jgi:hypothetical protein
LFSKVELDSVGIGIVCEWHQLATVEKLILLAVRYVAIDFRHPTLLDLDEIRIGRKSVVGVQCVLLLRAQEVIVVVVAIINCCSTTTAATAAAGRTAAALASL